MTLIRKILLTLGVALSVVSFCVPSAAGAAEIGVVVMHGKGGLPKGLVAPLADYLADRGFAVANLEMPWSKHKEYGESPDQGVEQIDRAFEKMKADGVKHMFLAGHSLGGIFAAYYATQRPLTGLVLIAPGGNVASKFWQKKTADSLAKADQQIADGKGDERSDFTDFEGAKGEFSIQTTANLYKAWFSLDSPLNQRKTYRNVPDSLPILNIVPVNDYKALQRQKSPLYDLLPHANGTEMYEPDTDHRGAPRDSAEKIAQWLEMIATR